MTVELIIQYAPYVVALGLLIWKGNYIFQNFVFKPLAGGNGVIQMDEITKANIVAMVWYALVKEATRGTMDQHVFSNEFFLFIFLALFSIAGLKHIKPRSLFGGKEQTENKNETPAS